MCTVSYIPTKANGGFVLTSNRDEKEIRETLPPMTYHIDKLSVCFPKDKLAGGSWIAIASNGRTCCLLNGGFETHSKQEYHTYSRGKVLKGAVSTSENVNDYLSNKDLSHVEPFTLITIDNKGFDVFEFIWDGKVKHASILDENQSYIWSSATLYNKKNREDRKKWFGQFLEKNANSMNSVKAFEFHSGHHTSNSEQNVVMQRQGGLKTVSITQVSNVNNELEMQYTDLLEKHKTICSL